MIANRSLAPLDAALLRGDGMRLLPDADDNRSANTSRAIYSVAHALRAVNGTRVALAGRILVRTSECESLFDDGTGQIGLTHDDLPGRPSPSIQLEGVLRRDRFGVHIEVDALR